MDDFPVIVPEDGGFAIYLNDERIDWYNNEADAEGVALSMVDSELNDESFFDRPLEESANLKESVFDSPNGHEPLYTGLIRKNALRESEDYLKLANIEQVETLFEKEEYNGKICMYVQTTPWGDGRWVHLISIEDINNLEYARFDQSSEDDYSANEKLYVFSGPVQMHSKDNFYDENMLINALSDGKIKLKI